MDLVNRDSDWQLRQIRRYFTSNVEENREQLQFLIREEDKRWIFKDEVAKVFEDSIKASFPELEEEEEADIDFCPKGVPDDYVCKNVLSIWAQIRKSHKLRKRYSRIHEPRYIGKAIRKNLVKSAGEMIKQSSSIHKMIKYGIDTWAPKLPVERVIVDFPSLDEDIHVGLFRRQAIGCTLIRMLRYSKVAVWSKGNFGGRYFQGHDIVKRWFSIKEIEGDKGNVVIDAKGKLPFILAKRDFIHFFKDLQALRYVIEEKKPDWIVYVTPVRQQEYIEICFAAAKLEKWIQSDMEGRWDPSYKNEYPVLTYAGYRSCGTKQDELTNLLDEVKARCVEVAEGMAAKLLGYTAEEVLDCVLAYTFLKNSRLVDCTFNEMVHQEGNTFIYLLNRRAEIRTIIKNSREDNDELKKASEFILENDEECGKAEERTLELHLLEFSGALEESCLCVLPHIMCEYLYQLSKKFTSYYLSVCKVGSVAKTSTLLLCEATAVVMEKCFHLLGITPGNTTGNTEVDGKSPDGKEKLPIKRSKGSLGSLNMITGKKNEQNKAAANGGYPKSAESGSEGSDGNSENGSQMKSGSRQDSIEATGEGSQNGNSANGGPNAPVNQTVAGPATNLNIGMEYWNGANSPNMPAMYGKVASGPVAGGMAPGARESQIWLQELSMLLRSQLSTKQPMDVNAPVAIEVATGKQEAGYFEDRCIIPSSVSVARDQPRNSRFEMFSIRPSITPTSVIEKGRLFGLIAIADKYATLSDVASHYGEPDFAYVPLFDLDWHHPMNMRSRGIIFLGNPNSRHSVPFSSSIEIRMELYVTTKMKEACFQLCSQKSTIGLSDFWKKKSDSMCAYFDVKGEGGSTRLHYILLKDAVDTSLKVRFKTNKIHGHKVRGYISAYYGSEFQYGCTGIEKAKYTSSLFQPDFPILLKDGCEICLKKSIIAVPKNGSLIIEAYLLEGESRQVLFDDFFEFILPTKGNDAEGSCEGYINGKGKDCSLVLELGWKYQA